MPLRAPTARLATLALTLASLASSDALARRVFQSHPATTVYVGTATLSAFEEISYETLNLSTGADSVIHLWDVDAGTELAYNDNRSSTTKASRISFRNWSLFSKKVLVVVRSASATTQGTATLLRNGATVGSIGVGGTPLTTPCGTHARVYSAHEPGQANNTRLLGLSATGRLRGYDDNSGTDTMAILARRSDYCTVVLGSVAGSRAGTANVYVVDTTTDSDGDGLGDSFEAEYGTCSTTACAYNPKDTDRDGLTDTAELLGIDYATAPQSLPAWGADPRQKDLFLEVDYKDDVSAAARLTPSDITLLRAFYAAAPAADVGNPNGKPGIRLHLDVGLTPTSPADERDYGSWGGSGSVPAATDYGSAPATYRHAIRNGVFRYALAYAGGGGQAYSDRLKWGVTATDRGVAALAHEIGHTVGLDHFGHRDWGTLNCKPNYASLMNYGFASEGFSNGDNGMPLLNPAALAESVGLGSAASSADLSGSPFFFGVSGDDVDWNRNGKIESDRLVRGGPTWATWVSCAALNANEQVLTDEEMSSTPVLFRLRERLYAMWVGPDGAVRYRQGSVAGALASGSCPGGDHLGATCMTWSAERTLATTVGAVSLHAATWGNRLYVAYRGADNTLRVLSSGTVDPSGNPTLWSTETRLAGITTTREPELHLLRVRASLYRVTTVLGLFFVDGATGRYRWALSGDTVNWTVQGELLGGSGSTITGKQSLNLASVGDTTCGAFTEADNRVHLRCYQPSTDRWAERVGAFPSADWAENKVKPAFTFHAVRGIDGQPVRGDATEGQFFLIVRKSTVPDLLVSSPIHATAPASNATFPQIGKVKDEWTTTPDGVGVELYEDLSLGAPKMLVPWKSDALGTPLVFYPLADGSVDVALTDGNDWLVMERGVCNALRGEAFCGNRDTSDGGY